MGVTCVPVEMTERGVVSVVLVGGPGVIGRLRGEGWRFLGTSSYGDVTYYWPGLAVPVWLTVASKGAAQ